MARVKVNFKVMLTSTVPWDVPEEKKIQTLKTEIWIMLEILEDADLQVALSQIYNENKSHGLVFLKFFLDSLTTGNYNCIFSWEPVIAW